MVDPKQLFLEVEVEDDDDGDEHDGLLLSRPTNKVATNKAKAATSTAPSFFKSRSALFWLAFVFAVLVATFMSGQPNESVEDVELKKEQDTTITDVGFNKGPPSSGVKSPPAAPPSSNAPTPAPVPLPPGFKIPETYYSAKYIPRGRPLTEEERAKVTERWGEWTLPLRSNSLPSGYPNNDIPYEEFPEGSWQADPDYLGQFLPAAISYCETAMEAILDEYGHTALQMPNATYEERTLMFSLTFRPDHNNPRQYPSINAGEASRETLVSIRKRLLHAIMTESEFRFVMGGHSAAAGHGNNFQQSYTLQVQKVMEPFLARLGVYFQAHNFGMGGLGTSQNALGAKDLYGRSDILMWDSGMTESDGPSKDLFARIGLLLHQPVLWGNPDGERYDAEGIKAGMITVGGGQYLLPYLDDLENIEDIPFWARYMNCSEALKDLCFKRRYNATCWEQRDDGLEPPQKQAGNPGGQAKWHPGNKDHQLRGRAIAYILIEQTLAGLKEWYNTPNFQLPNEAWHVTSDKERVKSGVLKLDDTPCGSFGILPKRICNIPLNSRSEMTPRRDPERTSLRSIMKEGCTIPEPKPNFYDPPDAFIPQLFHPDIDIVHILQNGIQFQDNQARKQALLERKYWQPNRKPITSGLEPGKGWGLDSMSNPSVCDGTWNSFCGRSSSNCMANGHNDNRGGLAFDGFSGWMMFDLENMKHGLIVVRMEDWRGPPSETKDWKCVNNQNCTDSEVSPPKVRRLGDGEDKRCTDWRFQFAIDGAVTSWDSPTFINLGERIQRVVPLWLLLDDEDWGEPRDVELAIRIEGCGRDFPLLLSHIYWA